MRLELGAGDRQTDGYVHNDARPLPHIAPLMVFDASAASAFIPVASCDEVRATHLLEHFSHLRTIAVLREWLACLKPGGLLYIEVPNLEYQAKLLLAGQPEEAIRLMYGDQDYVGNAHLTGFTQRTLCDAAIQAGFVGVQVWGSPGAVLMMEARRP